MDSPHKSCTAVAGGRSEGVLDAGRSLELDLTALVPPWESVSLPGASEVALVGLVDRSCSVPSAEYDAFGCFRILSAGSFTPCNWDACLALFSSTIFLREIISFVSSRLRVDCSRSPTGTDDLIGQPRNLGHSLD